MGGPGTLSKLARDRGPPLTTAAPQHGGSEMPPEADRAEEPSQHWVGWSVPCLGGPHSGSPRTAASWEGSRRNDSESPQSVPGLPSMESKEKG